MKIEYIKYTLYVFVALYILSSSGKSQMSYRKYDDLTRGVEYNIVKSQMESNHNTIKALNSQKSTLSSFKKEESIMKSRIQGVISAKQNENIRLNQKAILLIDSAPIVEVK